MHLSVFAAVFIGVGVIAAPASATVPLNLQLPTPVGALGTQNAPIVITPSPGTASGPVVVVQGAYGAVSETTAGTLVDPFLRLVLPVGVYVSNAPTGFTCTPVIHGIVGQQRTCDWPLPDTHLSGTQAIALQLELRVAYLTRRDGDAFQIGVSLMAASFDPDQPGAPNEDVATDSETLYGTVSAAAKVDAFITDPAYVGAVSQRWGVGPNGESGFLRQYQISLASAANAGNIIDSATFTVSLPAASVFSSLRLDGYGTYVGGAHAPDFNSCVGLGTCNGWTVTSGTTAVTLQRNASWAPAVPGRYAASGTASVFTAGQIVYVTAFAPCDRFNLNTAASDLQVTGVASAKDSSNSPLSVTGTLSTTTPVTASSGLANWTDPTTPPLGQTARWCVDQSLPTGVTGDRVVRGGRLWKNDGTIAENDLSANVAQNYSLNISTPTGVAQLDDVFLVDALPADLWAAPNAPAYGSAAVVSILPGAFVAYACDVALPPNFTSDDIDLANDCVAVTNTIPAGTTHIVFTAATLGVEAAWSGLALGLNPRVTVKYPIGYRHADGSTMATNTSWLYAGYGDDGVFIDRLNELDDYASDGVDLDATYSSGYEYNNGGDDNSWTLNIFSPTVAAQVESIRAEQPGGTPVSALERENAFRIRFGFDGVGGLGPTNAQLSITIPPELGPYLTGASITIPTNGCGTLTASAPVQSGLTFTVDLTGELVTGNGVTSCAPVNVSFAPILTNAPFSDGHLFEFSAQVTSEDGSVVYHSRDFEVPLKGQTGAQISNTPDGPSCGDFGFIRMPITLTNIGGKPIVAATVSIDVPAAVTTAPAAIFAPLLGSVVPTLGAVAGSHRPIELAWPAAENPLNPGESSTFWVDVPWGGGDFEFRIYGSVVGLSYTGDEELLAIDPAGYAVFSDDDCPGQIVVSKTFGAGGPAMAGVSFTLVGDGVDVTRQTNAAGVVVFGDLAAGSYALTEDLAALPGTAVWTSTLAPATNVTVSSFGTSNVGVVNTCNCNDSNACTVDSPCTIEGICNRSALDCGGITVGACEAAACDPAVGCVAEPALPTECAPPQNGWIFYVALAGTPAKQLRCVVYDSQPNAAPTCAIIDGNQCGN